MRDKLILSIMLSVFFVIQIPMLFSTLASDENIYFYMGKVVAEKGLVPHRDFFFAHPPIHIYMFATLIWLFGFHIWILKLFTVLVIIGCAIFVYLIAKERYDKKIGLTAVFLFLTSYDFLIFGSVSFGLEVSVLFFLISWYLLDKKPALSGLFFGLSLMVRLHLLPLGIV